MIIVTGASGFIGRRLVPRLLAARPVSDLRCLVKADDDAFGQQGTELLRSHGIQPVATDLVSGRGLSGLQSAELVFHLAANTHTWERDQRCNDLGTRNFLRALSPLWPDMHLVFTSSVSVMDNRRDWREPLRPDTRLDGPPLSRYGLSKWKAEEFLRAEAKRLGFRLSIARLSTVYGPEPRPNTFFDVLKEEVLKGSVMSRLNWPALTSFIHVDKVVECLLRIGDTPPGPGESRTLVLASESQTLQEAARLVYRALGLPYREIRLPRCAWAVAAGCTRGILGIADTFLPKLHNLLWRFNLVVSPVFHCDAELMHTRFPGLEFRRMSDCIGEVVRLNPIPAPGPEARTLRCASPKSFQSAQP